MRRLLVAGLLVATLGIIGLWSPATQAQDPCNGLVSPRLQIGDTARVLFNGDGLGSALRDNPGKEQSGSRFVTTMPEGTVITILEGPVCLDGMVWWQVSVPDGTQGWVAEGDAQQYYLEPFVLATEVLEPVYAPPRELQRWEVRYSGNVTTLVPLAVPYAEPRPAREVWQQPDIDAANAALAERRASCPDVLEDTPWEGVTDAGDAIVPEGEYDYYPSPDGGKVFLVRHFVLPIPECGGAPGPYFGISTTHLLREDRDIIDLFPYGQHGGVRSREACMSPDVDNLAWTTNLSEVVWSPDGDTVALTVRYLDQDTAGRPCAYYFVFLVDVFNGNVTPVAEGRRTFWASGGTRLHYLSFTVDNGYNILEERLMALSDSQTTQVNVSTAADGGVQFVPGSFNSTGVVLPVTADGTRVLVCNTLSGCPETLVFDLSRNQFSAQPIALPEDVIPREIAQVHFVANESRLLLLTTSGNVYLQSLREPDVGLWSAVMLEEVAGADATVVDVNLVPTGVAAVLELDSGSYVLLNTVSRDVQPLSGFDLVAPTDSDEPDTPEPTPAEE